MTRMATGWDDDDPKLTKEERWSLWITILGAIWMIGLLILIFSRLA